jgi:hypothetical protein
MTAAHVHCGSTGPTDCPGCARAYMADTLRLLTHGTTNRPAKSAAGTPSPGLVACGEDLTACAACGVPLRMLHGWPVDGAGGIDCPAGGIHDICPTEKGDAHA